MRKHISVGYEALWVKSCAKSWELVSNVNNTISLWRYCEIYLKEGDVVLLERRRLRIWQWLIQNISCDEICDCALFRCVVSLDKNKLSLSNKSRWIFDCSKRSPNTTLLVRKIVRNANKISLFAKREKIHRVQSKDNCLNG